MAADRDSKYDDKLPISTLKMVADVGTKALPEKQFVFCRDVLNGYALVRASRNASVDVPSLVVSCEELTSCYMA